MLIHCLVAIESIATCGIHFSICTGRTKVETPSSLIACLSLSSLISPQNRIVSESNSWFLAGYACVGRTAATMDNLIIPV